jgi:hypothetical protein
MSTIIVRTLRRIGDLDDRFYDDEFHRDAWNEASAIAMQLIVWATLLAAAVLPWVAGVPGMWVALGLLAATGTVSATMTWWFRHRTGIDPVALTRSMRVRTVVAVLAGCVAIAGAGHALSPHVDSSVVHGMYVGAVVGAAAAVIAAVRTRRRVAAAEAAME